VAHDYAEHSDILIYLTGKDRDINCRGDCHRYVRQGRQRALSRITDQCLKEG
jgi:hypothetical protein